MYKTKDVGTPSEPARVCVNSPSGVYGKPSSPKNNVVHIRGKKSNSGSNSCSCIFIRTEVVFCTTASYLYCSV